MTNRSTAVVFVTVLLGSVADVDTGASQRASAMQRTSEPGHYATVNGYRMYYEAVSYTHLTLPTILLV